LVIFFVEEMESFVVCNANGRVVIEQSWKARDFRACMQHVSQRILLDGSLPTRCTMGNVIVVSTTFAHLYFIALTTRETSPLATMELLHSIRDVLVDYFGLVSEAIIKDNFVLIYSLLQEMLDDGHAYITESNALKELVPPPSLYTKVKSSLMASTDDTPTIHLSHQLPWRRQGVVYSQNEVFFDIVEELNATLDHTGAVVHGHVNGSVVCTSKLSGIPDLQVTCGNTQNVLHDVTLHPCVRQAVFHEQHQRLSFIPPDGKFTLLRYTPKLHMRNALPLMLTIGFHDETPVSVKFEVRMNLKHTNGKPLTNVAVEFGLPYTHATARATCSVGSCYYDARTLSIRWDMDQVMAGVTSPHLTGTILLDDLSTRIAQCMRCTFTIDGYIPTNLRINSLNIVGESYTHFKGLKTTTKTGSLLFRL
jgi:AP-3 complex subunit mu